MNKLILGIALLALGGCAAPQSFEKIVPIQAELHICSDRSYFPAGHEKSLGVATQRRGKNKIYVTGYIKKGKYYIDNLGTLGHELAHIAEYHDILIADPDTY